MKFSGYWLRGARAHIRRHIHRDTHIETQRQRHGERERERGMGQEERRQVSIFQTTLAYVYAIIKLGV